MLAHRSLKTTIVAGLAVSFAGGFSPASTTENRFTDLVIVPLKQGINNIPRFSDDGRDAIIVLGWRDNGNAHGYDVYVVMLPTEKGGADWNIALGPDGSEVIKDQPHLGEDMVKSVRFVRGKLNGYNHSMLITATRDVTDGYGDPAFAEIEVSLLTGGDIELGTTFDRFEPAYTFRTSRQYCNAEYALASEMGLPRRQNFEGSDPVTGC